MNKFKKLVGIALVFSLSACNIAQQALPTGENDSAFTFSQFSDVPVPVDAAMNLDRTYIFGRDDKWLGRIVFTAPYAVGSVFDFYMEEMPKFGWKEVTSVRGSVSVLTYSRKSRVAMIQLEPSSFQGTVVSFTVSLTPETKELVAKSFSQTTSQNQATAKTSTQQRAVTQQATQTQTMSNARQAATQTQYVQQPVNKATQGSLGLGSASNAYYPSQSQGVGTPPTGYTY